MDLTTALAHIDMDGDMGDAGLPGTGINSGEKTSILTRLLALESMGLAGLADTGGLASASDGKIILRSGGQWVLHDLPGSAVWGGVTGTLAAQTDLQDALNARAAVNHTHNQTLKDVVEASNLANISGGTTVLATTTITLVSGPVYDIDAMLILEGYGNSGTIGIGKLRVSIAGNSRTSPVDLSWEQGVDAPKMQAHTRSVTGTGADITVSGSFVWTSGTLKPWHVQLIYRAEPRR